MLQRGPQSNLSQQSIADLRDPIQNDSLEGWQRSEGGLECSKADPSALSQVELPACNTSKGSSLLPSANSETNPWQLQEGVSMPARSSSLHATYPRGQGGCSLPTLKRILGIAGGGVQGMV